MRLWLGYILSGLGGALVGVGCALVARGIVERKFNGEKEVKEVTNP
jgi:hypothetical protein